MNDYVFQIVSNKEFAEFVNNNSTTVSDGVPLAGTVINGELKIFPKPSATEEGKNIELMVYLSASTTTISSTTEPEVPEMYDKAIELYVTSQFLTGAARSQYLIEFENEIKRLKPITHRKHFNLNRPSVW